MCHAFGRPSRAVACASAAADHVRVNAPRFSNRQNQRHDLADGRVLFESRSVAVTAIVLARNGEAGAFHALVGERGPRVDKSGSWCLVCGYLDWDESLSDAVRREVFEEAGVDLAALEAAGEAWVSKQPLFIQSDPSAHRQNVTARFLASLSRLVPITTEHAEPGEVTQLAWLPLETDAIDAKPWAFHHEEILHELKAFFDEEQNHQRANAESPLRFYRKVREADV